MNVEDRPDDWEEELKRPEFSPAFEALADEAHNHLSPIQDKVTEQYGLNDYETWNFDQTTGVLSFFNGKDEKIRIHCQAVGSFSVISDSWLWASSSK